MLWHRLASLARGGPGLRDPAGCSHQLVVLDGAWCEEGDELCWEGLGHLETSEVGGVLESTGTGASGPPTVRGAAACRA